MFHGKIQPVISWNQSIGSREEERDSAECGRRLAAEGGGGEEHVKLRSVQMKTYPPGHRE